MSKAFNNGDNGDPLSDRTFADNKGAGVSQLAPSMDWGRIDEHQHCVQFYESEEFLLSLLTDFIGTGLKMGDGCIVVATHAHREALDEQLALKGLDVEGARSSGQYVALDAVETLSMFTVGGKQDPVLFKEVIGNIINGARSGRPSVRVYGEMVALLWAEGKHGEAISLEGLWNEMLKLHSFSLLCGYPLNGFCDEAQAESLHSVCAAHSSVVPAESYTSLKDDHERLQAIIQLQRKARLLETEVEERKEAEAALRLVKEELEELLARERIARAEAESANRLKDEFLATVSHELRTPLTAILGWSHMLRHNRLSGAAAERAIKTIERNAKAQAQLVEDILDVSRVITGNLRLKVEQVDAATIINAAIDSVQLAADSKSIRLEVTLDPRARRIQGDAGRLQQVVWNLLSNAIKFTPSGGQVRVRLERASSHVQIKVSDTGQGISPDFLPFLFDRFRQADGSSTRRQGGLGLGLAFVRHLVELHGGTVHAESPGAGLGATFIVRLPLAIERATPVIGGRRDGPSMADDVIAHPRALPSLQGVRVLLVDDDSETLKLMAVLLTEYKATVQTASSVIEALEVFEWYRPDVLISDVAMPGEDGYSLIQKIRAREAEAADNRMTRAIALTAYARVEDRMHALSAGFNMFVPKPVEPVELITSIAALAEQGTD